MECGAAVADAPVHGDEYYRALWDARRAKWRAAKDFKPELHKIYIGAKLNPKSNIWILSRVRWDDDRSFYVYVQESGAEHAYNLYCPVDFVAEDELGTPCAAQGLPSIAA
jgi:hypothetical protein